MNRHEGKRGHGAGPRRQPTGPRPPGERPLFEFSAGGLVLEGGRVLLIRARDLKGRPVWTFPKGKLDPGETSEQAAVREVQEETGWRCRIEGELPRSRYWFQREGRRVRKTVRWFRMAPLEQVGQPDDEIDEIAWLPVADAPARLTYDSDKDLLKHALEPGAAPP